MVTPKRRSTTDIVVIIFTLMVSLAVLFLTLGLIYIKISHPEAAALKASELLANILTTVVGALVGFIGGRAAGRAEGALNGEG